MNFKRIFYGKYSKVIFSIILGFGLATFFRKACSSRKCISFKTPDVKKVVGNVYKYDGKYYEFTPQATHCDQSKKIIHYA